MKWLEDDDAPWPARSIRKLRSAFVAWRWSGPIVRLLVGAAGLLLLAAIGRSALAGSSAQTPPPAVPPVPNTSSEAPAGAPPPAASAAALPAPPAGPAAQRGRATPDDPVVLNVAAFEDLRRLPGIGPKRAEAILALRQRLGRFRQVEDLLKVKGIGRATLRKLRPLVRLDAPP